MEDVSSCVFDTWMLGRCLNFATLFSGGFSNRDSPIIMGALKSQILFLWKFSILNPILKGNPEIQTLFLMEILKCKPYSYGESPNKKPFLSYHPVYRAEQGPRDMNASFKCCIRITSRAYIPRITNLKMVAETGFKQLLYLRNKND